MFKNRKRVLLSSLLLIILALPALALVTSRRRKRISSPTKAVSVKRMQVAAPTGNAVSNAKERVEGEVIAVTPHGFEPTEITRPHKHFVLVIDNRSGLSEIDLRLDQEHGNRLRDVRIRREQRNWSDDLNLDPGRYVLSEATHPLWICRITITAN